MPESGQGHLKWFSGHHVGFFEEQRRHSTILTIKDQYGYQAFMGNMFVDLNKSSSV